MIYKKIHKILTSLIIVLIVVSIMGCNNDLSSTEKHMVTNNVNDGNVNTSEVKYNDEAQVNGFENIEAESIYDQMFETDEFKSVYDYNNLNNNVLDIYQLDSYIAEKYNFEIESVTGYELIENLLYYEFYANKKTYLLNPISKQLFEIIDDSNGIIKPIILDEKIEVMNYYEFVTSIQSNVEIILWEGNYDSSTYLKKDFTNDYVLLEDFNTSISNVENLRIIGHPKYKKRVEFITDDPDATVLNFKNCKNIILRNLKLSHSERNTKCFGVTGWIKDSENILIDDCDLYGCGRIGLSINNSMGIEIRDSYIYDCSEYEIFIMNSKDVIFNNCIIEDTNKLNIEIINTFNVTFLDSVIIEHDDTPQLNSHVEMFYYFFDSDIDLMLGSGDSNLLYMNKDSLSPFTDEKFEDVGWSEHPKLINSWIGNKATYENYSQIKNSFETDKTNVTNLHLIKDNINSDENKLKVSFTTIEEIDREYLKSYITYLYDSISNIEAETIFPLELTFNDKVKVEILTKEKFSKWYQTGDLFNDNISVNIIDLEYKIISLLGSDKTILTTEELQNIIDEFLIAGDRFDTKVHDDGRYIEWQFEEVSVNQNKLIYKYSFLLGTPFLGDLFHRDILSRIEIDGFTGEVHMIDNNKFKEPIIVLSDEYLNFFESDTYLTHELKFYPNNSISFALHENNEYIEILQILYDESDYGIYASPVIVHILKDEFGEVDFKTYHIDYENELEVWSYD